MKNRKQKHNNKLKFLGGIVTFAILAFALLSYTCPETTIGICKSLGVAGTGSASLMLAPLAFRMHRDPNPDQAGGGVLSKEAEAALLSKINGELKSKWDEFVKTFKDSPEMKSMMDKVGKIDDLEKKAKDIKTQEDHDKVTKEIERLGLELKALTEKPGKKEIKSFGDAVMAALKEKETEWKSVCLDAKGKPRGGVGEWGGKQFNLDLKAVVNVTDDTTILAGDTNYSMTQFSGIISKIRKRILTYLNKVSVGTTTGQTVYWIEEHTEAGTPIMIHEAATKTKLSVLYKEMKADVKKIAVYGKMSTEWMADLPQLVNYLQNNLVKRLDIVTEDQLFNGDGTGDNLNGLSLNATAFSAGSLANQVPDANRFDVVRALALQVELNFGIANGMFVNPTDLAAMQLTKNSQGSYVMPPFASANGTSVYGIEINPTVAIDADDFIGGDLTVQNVLFKEGLNIRFGETGTDMIDNLKTIVIEQRLVQFRSANDNQVIITGGFNQAIRDLDPAS